MQSKHLGKKEHLDRDIWCTSMPNQQRDLPSASPGFGVMRHVDYSR